MKWLDSEIREGMLKLVIVLAAFSLFTLQPTVALADLEDVEKATQTARTNYVDRFGAFTQDKNFLGKPSDPSGKEIPAGGAKSRLDSDDGNPFRSDLTYHDFAYDVKDEVFDKEQEELRKAGKGGGKTRTLFAGVSPHGAISGAGGSSELERAVYQEHEKFYKEDTADDKKKREEEKGIKLVSIFKIETKEVSKQDAQGGAGAIPTPKPPPGAIPTPAAAATSANNPKDAFDRIERWEMRPEAEKKIAEVGSKSFDTLERAARDNDKKNDPTVMGNILMYYGAASEAVDAMWRSTVANLGQARAFNAVRDQGAGNIQLSEDVTDCDAWSQKITAKLAKQDPKVAQARQESIKKMVGQCKQLGAQSFSKINPHFEFDKNSKEEALKELGPEKEEARERDWRVSLQTWAKAGVAANEVTSNWQKNYTQKDLKAKVVTEYDKDGKPAKTEDLTVNEQLDLYNQDLKSASKSYEDIRERMGKLNSDPKKILEYQKQKGKEYLGNVVKVSKDALVEDVETTKKDPTVPVDNYQQLLIKPKSGQGSK